MPEPIAPSKTQGVSSAVAPLFNKLLGGENQVGLGLFPDVAEGELVVRVGPVSDKPVDTAVGAGAPMTVGPVLVDSKSLVAQGGFRSPESVTVAVVGGKRAQAAGLDLFGFSLTDTSAAAGKDVKDPPAVRVVMDYSDFRYLFGGDWASRLRLVKYPACVLTSPDKPECSTGVVVETANDVATGEITADVVVDVPGDVAVVPDGGVIKDPVGDAVPVDPKPQNGVPDVTTPAKDAGVTVKPSVGAAGASRATHSLPARRSGSGGSVYGWSAGYSSNLGNYAATPLSSAASWDVGLGMGSFDWSYPVPVPASGFGAAPSVGFSYSSSAVDGVVSDENNQGLLGAGWNLYSGGFIERTYASCRADGGAIDDFCWVSDNATINLNGHSSELVPVGAPTATFSEWRLKDDPGWKVQRQRNFVAATPEDNLGEIWRVWSPDGTEYDFGLRAQTPGGTATNSVLHVPVFGNNTGEPCNGAPGNWCNQAWRWNLDRVRDRGGYPPDCVSGVA